MTHTLGNGVRICTVDVPEGAINIGFLTVHNMLEWKKKKSKIYWDCKLLPPGNWELLGRRDEVSEETWKGIVEAEPAFRHKCKPCYKHYSIPNGFGFQVLNTATASARSLIAGNPVVLIDNSKKVRV